MKKKSILAMALTSVLLVSVSGCAESGQVISNKEMQAIPRDAIGVYVVIDCSGSMLDPVQNKDGALEPKYVIANRSLIALGNKLDDYMKAAYGRSMLVGIVKISGSAGLSAREYRTNNVTGMFQNWVALYKGPNKGTPIGDAMTIATRDLNNVPLKSKHIIVITDGENTSGPSPQEVMPSMLKTAEGYGTPLGVYFVAFDVNSATFKKVEELGGVVVGADNEKQLNEKIDYILNEKILLEKEE